MQIVIVEDNAQFAEGVVGMLEEYFLKEEIAATVRHQEAAGLLDELKKGQCCDLCLLDVEMPVLDGLTLAKKIRDLNSDIRIVFLTSHERYALSGYEVRADGYVLKENCRRELPPLIGRLYQEELAKREEFYAICTETQGYKLRIADILYLEKEKKYVVFRCVGKREYRERDTLENVMGRLPQEKFAFIDKGVIVNLGHVVQWGKLSFTMRDGTVLGVSRRTWQAAKNKLYTYLRVK